MSPRFESLQRSGRSYLRRFGSKQTLGSDLKAGLVLGVESVPDGLAAGLLAGVNPLHGLYGYLAGTVGGALATGSAFMTVQATGAMAVVISDVPQTQSGADAGRALATLALLTGVIMLALGIAKLGSLVRFIPTAVLVGFINAVAISIVLGQLDNFTGYESSGSNRILKAFDTVLHVFEFSWPSLLVGVTTVALILLLERTRLGALAMVVAIVCASGLAAFLGVIAPGNPVQLVASIAEVPNALPGLALPDFSLVLPLIVPALSLALVGLVQGAAVTGSIPNPDGRYPDPSADFRGQGIANPAAGFFQGMPVGGSMSATALVKAAGAKSALANLIAGAVMAVTILALGPVIGFIAMPALAGLLILVGFRTFKPHDIVMVWRTGPIQAAVFTVTFVLTLIIPLQYAVLTGVGLAVILHIARQSNRITIRRWVFDGDSPLPRETAPPATLTPGELLILAPYGSLFFAAAPVFEAQLPHVPAHSERSVVIIRLRGKEELGSTFIKIIDQYAGQLATAGGALMLVGVSDKVREQLAVTGVLTRIGAERVFLATPAVGDSLTRAVTAAERWAARG
ncbi:SulP family inorganic anion transporter [Leucobacter sp. G161]|uniref:SulP family inorganic anion transporter n=1 Tax=Leucobacter sp. G161 TaxID=663704 RepID=UPI0009F9DC7C|nr:SulP family inorganic anion transporter [Leucobacter sp. G161]